MPDLNGVPASGPVRDLAATMTNGHGAGLASPSALRRAILVRLRRDGPGSPDEIAGALDASRTGVLQQLRALELAHLVEHRTVRHGVGRPRHVYDITSDAQELFPANYDGLAAGLIEAIVAVGGDDLIEQVFAARRRQIGSRIRQRIDERLPPDATLADRVGELAVIQDELGYLTTASVGEDGSLRLSEHNCAIFQVAQGEPSACEAELALFREVLGTDVERESHIVAGDRCCTYRIGTGAES